MVTLTTADAAKVYRIPARTIRRWFGEGRLTAHGTDRRREWDAAELDQLADLRSGPHLPKRRSDRKL